MKTDRNATNTVWNLTKLVIVMQFFLIETPRIPLPWCQLQLNVVYPYIFFLFFALFPGQKGKDLNLFFFDLDLHLRLISAAFSPREL